MGMGVLLEIECTCEYMNENEWRELGEEKN